MSSALVDTLAGIEAAWLVQQVYGSLLGEWPKSEDEFAKMLANYGFQRQLKYHWVFLSDPKGIATVDGNPVTFSFVNLRYEPRVPADAAPEVLSTLRSAAEVVAFSTPDELVLNFKEASANSHSRTQVVLGLPGGVWKRTETVVFRGAR